MYHKRLVQSNINYYSLPPYIIQHLRSHDNSCKVYSSQGIKGMEKWQLRCTATLGCPTSRCGFNYEPHNALANKFNNSSTFADSQCTHLPNFGEVEQSAAELFWAQRASFHHGTNYIQFGAHHRPIIGAPQVCFRYPDIPNFALFDLP